MQLIFKLYTKILFSTGLYTLGNIPTKMGLSEVSHKRVKHHRINILKAIQRSVAQKHHPMFEGKKGDPESRLFSASWLFYVWEAKRDRGLIISEFKQLLSLPPFSLSLLLWLSLNYQSISNSTLHLQPLWNGQKQNSEQFLFKWLEIPNLLKRLKNVSQCQQHSQGPVKI